MDREIFYWEKPPDVLLKELKTSTDGLTSAESKKRLQAYGSNTLSSKSQSIILRFVSQFFTPFTLILLTAGSISAFLGEVADFIIISVIILISGCIDFYQQYQAENAVEKLRSKVSITSTVLRNGKREEVLVSKIVVGDIVLLSSGDVVPADARLLTEKDFTVDQAVLTGESFPQEKTIDIIDKENGDIVSRRNTVFMGTHVVSGEAQVVIVRIGKQTEFGNIAQSLNIKKPENEFNLGIRNFGYFLMKVTFTLTFVVFFTNTFIRHDVLSSLLFALALAVGITPELLPIIITITLSKGAIRMSRKEVIVKYLPAIQNLGSMNILCTDKTGTLTEGTIKLSAYENADVQNDEKVFHYCYLNSYFQTSLRSPIDEAVVKSKKIKIDDYKKIDEIPYDFFRKCLSVVVQNNQGIILTTKGSFNSIIAKSNKYLENEKILELTKEKKDELKKRFINISSEGYRVLAIAFKNITDEKIYSPKDETDLIFVGLLSFEDRPKESVKEALRLIEKQGVKIKVLTGDNEHISKKICEELELPIDGILTGHEIDNMTDEAFLHLVQTTTIFAELNPNHKKRIVMAFKQTGNVVGFLGDGINDAPSLHVADVGISVNNAVDVAKESADIILLRKDLHVLKDGIYEGRRTYTNVMKYVMMSTSSNFGNMLSVAIASLFLPFLPMLPIQILLNNLLYDLSQLFIPNDNVSKESLDHPRKWDIKFIKSFMIFFGPLSSVFDFATFFVMLYIFKASISLFQTSWFVESLVTQALIIFSIRTVKIPFYKSKPGSSVLIGSFLTVIIALTFPFTPLARIFSFVPPPVAFYSVLGSFVIFYFLLVEIAKKHFYKKFNI